MSKAKSAKSGAMIVREYLKHGENASEFTAVEFMEFWKGCSSEDKADFSAYAAGQLGLKKNAEGKYE